MSINELELPVGGHLAGLKYRLHGTLGMFGAPMLFIEMLVRAFMDEPEKIDAQFVGATGVFYIGGWIAVALAMRGLRATGAGSASLAVFVIQTAGLIFAFLFSVQQLTGVDFSNGGLFFKITDIAYPFSHMLMLVVGSMVWRARVIKGFARIAPFGVALMLPLFFLLGTFLGMAAATLISTGLAAISLFVIARNVQVYKIENKLSGR